MSAREGIVPSRTFDGRWLIAAALLGYFSILYLSSMEIGSRGAWARFGVPALSPAFADLRVITTALDSSRDGHDPLVSNPHDPWKRPMNYPRVWLAAKFLGLTEQHTLALGLIFAATFYTSGFLLIGRVGLIEGAVYVLLLCSPTLMLAIERGNIDLIVFGLLTLAAALWSRGCSRVWPIAVILVAAILKLYPICALAIALRDRTRNSMVAAGIGAAGFAVYLVATRHDIAAGIAGTPATLFPAYGRELLFRMLEDNGFGGNRSFHSFLFVGVILIGALLVALRVPAPRFSSGPAEKMIIAMAIYAGTFVVLTSFSYRLVFLLLAVPQLLCWCRERGAYRYFALANLVALAATLYFSVISEPWSLFTKDGATWLLLGSAFFILLKSALPPCDEKPEACPVPAG